VTFGHRLGREQVPVRHVCASKEVRAARSAASQSRRVAGRRGGGKPLSP
jgi:hypothetical protein